MKKTQSRLMRRAKLFTELLLGGMSYNVKSWLNVNQYIEFLVFCVTARCDSRCKACDVWKGNNRKKIQEELTLEQIDRIFSDRLFQRMKELNLQGGEATMREDLVELTEVILKRVRSLRSVGVTSNGLDTEMVVRQAHDLYDLCQRYEVEFAINFSIDGVGSYHDFARGEKAFERVSDSIVRLADLRKKPGFFLGTNCVLSAHNIENIDEILRFQNETFGITNLAVVEFRDHFANTEESPYAEKLLFERNPEAKAKLIDFLKAHRRPTCFGDLAAYRYEKLREMIEEGRRRSLPCKYKISSAVLDHGGDLRLCAESESLGNCVEQVPSEIYFTKNTKRVRKELYAKKCHQCYPYGFYHEEQAREFVNYILYYLRTRLKAS